MCLLVGILHLPRRKMENLYREMMEMREHLLRRIELLEDDVDRLTQENMDYAKELYIMEKSIDDRINILFEEIERTDWYEGQESSEEDYQTSEETS